MKWLGLHAAAGVGKDTAADFIIAEFGGEKVSLADPMKHLCRDVLGFSHQQLWGPSELRNQPDVRYTGDQRPASCHVARVKLRERGGPWVSQVLPHFGPDKQIEAFHALMVWLEDCLRQTGLTARYALQTLGTEWGRAQDPNIWLLYADADAIRRDIKGYVIIPDCRFINEAQFLHSKKAPLIEINRPGYDGSQAMAAGVAAHQSEMERVKQADAFKKYVTYTIKNDDTLDTFKERIWGVLSPEVPWPKKPSKPSIVSTPSTPTESATATQDSSLSTSNIAAPGSSSSPTNTNESSSASSSTTTAPPKTLSAKELRRLQQKTGGTGPEIAPKS